MRIMGILKTTRPGDEPGWQWRHDYPGRRAKVNSVECILSECGGLDWGMTGKYVIE